MLYFALPSVLFSYLNIYKLKLNDEPVRDKPNKMDQNIDFCVLVFYKRINTAL